MALDTTPLRLDQRSGVPLHVQLEQALKGQIAARHWPSGDMIPSERELMRVLGVSRATVRQAIGSLMGQGLLRRVHGRGTFVAQPRIDQPMERLYSFAAQVQALGRVLRDRIIQRKTIPAPPDLAAALGIALGESLIHIQRLRVLDEAPFTLDNFYIAERLCPALLHDPLDGSLYELLTDRYHLPPLHASDTLEPTVADRAMAYYLQVPFGAPLMFVERVGYTTGDLPLHVGRNYVRGDMCRFRIDLQQKPATIELKSVGGDHN